ncbi:MAG: ubiquinol-cytochrome C chaperone family protein [Hyphomicrobiaceae bacterium]
MKSRNDEARTASELYGRLVARSRAPWFYAGLGVPDTPEGRLEMVMLHVVLALRRLAAEGQPGQLLARALTETFVTDMDDCLREMGVGDIAVAGKVKKAAAALYDRNRDYGEALAIPPGDPGDGDKLAGLLAEHVLGRKGGAAEELAVYAREAETHLRETNRASVLCGQMLLADLDGNGQERLQ